MCEFCINHGEGKKWYEVMDNYSKEMYARDNREKYMRHFLPNILRNGSINLARLDRLKTKMPLAYRFVRKLATRSMKRNHFGQVVPVEDAEMIIDMVQSVTRVPCVCRMATRGRKDARYCLLLGIDPNGIFGDYPDLQASLETLTAVEARELLRQFDREGLIHSVWTFKTPFIGAICNCNQDCLAYRTQVTADLMQVMFRGEYIAEIDPARCAGCRGCEKVCSFGAIEFSVQSGKFLVNPRQCYGCGLCRSACHKEAVSLLERGNLPELREVW